MRNLRASPAVISELTATYVAFQHFKLSAIAGTAPNSVYYAYDAATGTYWAMASFLPSAAVSHSKPGSVLYNVLVNMQSGGDQGMFTMAPGGAWQGQRAGVPPGCAIQHFFPKAVLAVWALTKLTCPLAG